MRTWETRYAPHRDRPSTIAVFAQRCIERLGREDLRKLARGACRQSASQRDRITTRWREDPTLASGTAAAVRLAQATPNGLARSSRRSYAKKKGCRGGGGSIPKKGLSIKRLSMGKAHEEWTRFPAAHRAAKLPSQCLLETVRGGGSGSDDSGSVRHCPFSHPDLGSDSEGSPRPFLPCEFKCRIDNQNSLSLVP